MHTRFSVFTAVCFGYFLVVGCQNKNNEAVVPGVTLKPVATSQVQWTGVAVTKDNQ